MSSEDLPIRRSSRLILLDPQDRLLLFRYQGEHKPPFWSTAGGELQDAESFRQAAARELDEETGFDAVIGDLICTREAVYAVAESTPARWQEQYFLVRCDGGIPSNQGWTPEEHRTIADCKWWSEADVQSTDETFLPGWLPDLRRHVVSDRSCRFEP